MLSALSIVTLASSPLKYLLLFVLLSEEELKGIHTANISYSGCFVLSLCFIKVL